MTENEKTLQKFYDAFSAGDASTMCSCYHPAVKFRDPVFGLLQGEKVCLMWKMLIERSKGNIKIEFTNLQADEYLGSGNWIASYNFSKTNRKVINTISSQFHFKEGLIIKHTDDFDIWKWSKQAFGWTGVLFGWTGFMQKKIHEKAIASLNSYQKQFNAN